MGRQAIGSNAFIINDKNEILLLKRSKDDSAFPNNWELAGGGVWYGETPQDSLVREVKEECGLNIKVLIPLSVNTFYISDEQVFETTFLCNVYVGKFDITLSDEHSEYKWISLEKIKSIGLSAYISKVIQSSKKSLEFQRK